MDGIPVKVTAFLRKYRIALAVLLLGLALMVFPTSRPSKQAEEAPAPPQTQSLPSASEDLAQILSQISGVGKVQVYLTLDAGAQTLYQEDETISGGENSSSVRRETVIIADSNRAQSGLIRQTIPPVYRGAIIVCQGADKAQVRLDVVDAVSKATGLGTDRITVLKMK